MTSDLDVSPVGGPRQRWTDPRDGSWYENLRYPSREDMRQRIAQLCEQVSMYDDAHAMDAMHIEELKGRIGFLEKWLDARQEEAKKYIAELCRLRRQCNVDQ